MPFARSARSFLFLVTLGTLSVLASITANAADTLVATLPGEFSVDNKGSANYSIALTIPPGRQGMQPKLSLNYSSSGGNGPLGVGFALSTGFPQAITRGRSILARDGVTRGVNFDDTNPDLALRDKFYLDGKRLICVAGSYGQAGSAYRTEVDSFVTITTNATGSTIETFVVTDKSGTKMTFGKIAGADDAYQMGGDEPQGLAHAWALKQVEDATGNYCELTYSNLTGGESVLWKISYTGRASPLVTPSALVELLYNTATVEGVNERRDASTSFVARRRFSHTARLDSISATFATDSGVVETERYTLGYEYAPHSGRTRLRSLAAQLRNPSTGLNGLVPSTQFSWSNETMVTAPAQPQSIPGTYCYGPVAGLGTEFPENVPNDTANTFSSCPGDRQYKFGDFDGDGRTDYLSTLNGFSVYLSNGTGFKAPTSWSEALPQRFRSVHLGDFNGDGKQDVLFGLGSRVFLSDGTRFVGFDGGTTPSDTRPLAEIRSIFRDPTTNPEQPNSFHFLCRDGAGADARVTVADFNGDGMDDILLHGYDGYTYVLLSTGHGFAAPVKTSVRDGTSQTVIPTWEMWSAQFLGDILPPSNYSIQPIPCDLNGDGMQDYAYVWTIREMLAGSSYRINRALEYKLSLGNGDFVIGSSIDAQIALTNSGGGLRLGVIYAVMPTDVNGDGLTDFLVLGDGKIDGSSGIPGAIPEAQRRRWTLFLNHGARDGAVYFDTIPGAVPNTVTVGGASFNTFYTAFEGYDSGLLAPHTVGRTPPYDVLYPVVECSGGQGMQLTDFNGDGFADLVWYSSANNSWWVIYSNGGRPDVSGAYFGSPTRLTDNARPVAGIWETSPCSPTTGNTALYTNWKTLAACVDLNGDGRQDWVSSTVNTGIQTALDGIALSPTQPGDLVLSVTDGLGRKTEIAYKAAKDDSVYTPGAPVAYPIRELRASSPVVAEVWKDSGSGAPADRANFSYQYSGNRLDLSGRGSLGFHSFVTLDRQTNLFKYQFLAQSFPMTGLTAREQTYRYWDDATNVSFRLINSHDNTVVFDEVVNPAANNAPWGTVYPFISKAVESRWENSTVRHFPASGSGEWAKAGSPESKPELLFTKVLPPNPHITVTATSRFDNQTAAQTSIPGGYYASDRTADWSAAGDNSVKGSTDYAIFHALPFPRLITYGNLKELATDYGDSFSETVNTTYHPPATVGGLTGLAQDVTTTVGAPAPYNTAADTSAPTKSYTYWQNGSTWTPLVETETIDADRDGAGTSTLDLKTTYVRDSRGRVQETQLTGKVDSTAPTTISTLTVSKVTTFNNSFDLPEVVENAYGHATTTAYHEFLGLPIWVTDVNSAKIETDYDALGRAIQTRDLNLALQSDSTFAWTTATASDWKKSQSVAVPGTVTDGLALSSVYAVRTTSTSRAVTGVSMQPPVTAYFDRLGRTIRTVREGFADQKTTTDTIYNKLGQIVATSLPYAVGATPLWTRTTYDKLGRVATVTAPNLTVTTNTYSGRATQVSVDAPLLGGINPLAQVNTTLVDAKGRTIKVWNADNVPTSLDPKTGSTDAASVEYKLDGFGRMRSTVLRGNSEGAFTTVTADYDALGRQTQLNDPDKGLWKYTNNVLGQVLTQEDARGNVTTSTFDPLGRLLTRTTTEAATVANPIGPVETTSWYYYDTAANAARHTVTKGEQGWIGSLQREEAATPAAPGYASSDPAAGKTATFHYFDAKGRPSITLTTIDKKWFYTCTDYDAAGRVGSVRNFWKPSGFEAPTDKPYMWQDFGYSYKYDSESYLLELRDSSGQVWWEADATAGYDHLDRPTLVRKGHGHWTKRTYRPEDGVLTAIQTGPAPGSATVQNLGFTFDGLGNLTKRTDGAPLNGGSALSETFGYDNLNRLTKRDGVTIIAYSINGNVSSKPDVNGGASGTYAYTSTHPHAVTSAFGYAMAYDANGNLETRIRSSSSETWVTRWAGFDKPRWLAKTTGTTTAGSEFLYNANRSRVIQAEFDSVTGSGTTATPNHYNRKRLYAWGAAGEIDYKNLNPTGGADAATWQLDTIRLYVPGPDGVIGAMEFAPNSPPEQIKKTKRSLVYHYDHLGSVDTVTFLGDSTTHVALDDTGKQARHSFDPWGQRRDPNDWSGQPVNTTIGGHTDVTPRGFTGHEMLDSTGLVHMNGRIYDPLLGRFLSADLVVDDPKDLQGYNRYSYVKNRPLTLTDPSGFSPFGEQFGRTGGNAIADWVMRKVLGPEKADQAIANREMVQREADKGTMVGGALVVGTVATGGAGMVIGEAALAGNTAAQLIVAGTAAVGLVDGTQKMAEGAGEFSVNPSVDSAAKIVAGGLEAGLSVAGVASVRTALAEAPVVSSTAASTRTTTAADSADTPAPAVLRAEGEAVRVRHHTDIDAGRKIMADNKIQVSREAQNLPPGVDVEVAPFGSASTASAELGATRSGAYVETTVARSSLTPTPKVSEANRNAARIVTDTPLQLNDPKLVNTKPWWAFWR